MKEGQEKSSKSKQAESFLKDLTSGSNFDPDLSEEKIKNTSTVSGRRIVNHLTGKEKLSEEQVEQVKKDRKIGRYLP